MAWCWKRTSFHVYEQLLLSENLWRHWTQQPFCGSCLHLLVAAALSAFIWGCWALSLRALRQAAESRVFSFPVYFNYQLSSILAPSVQREAVGLNHVLCSNYHHLNDVYLCTGSTWLRWWGACMLDQADKLLLFPFRDCSMSFTHFWIPRSDVAGDANRSIAISAAFSASLLICLHSQRGVCGSYQLSASPSTPLELWKHFCNSSHSSRWFFTFTIIVALWSLSQILEQPISGILSSRFVRMQNQWQAWKLRMFYSMKTLVEDFCWIFMYVITPKCMTSNLLIDIVWETNAEFYCIFLFSSSCRNTGIPVHIFSYLFLLSALPVQAVDFSWWDCPSWGARRWPGMRHSQLHSAYCRMIKGLWTWATERFKNFLKVV